METYPLLQPNQILAATGHRPDKLGGYGNAAFRRLVAFAAYHLELLQPQHVFDGVALGWDLAVAAACVEIGIPWTACIPCEGQDAKWTMVQSRQYRTLVAKATDRVLVSEGGYAWWKMIRRDEYMVDRAGLVFAVFNGHLEGGTYKTVEYANSQRKPVLNLYHSWKELEENPFLEPL